MAQADKLVLTGRIVCFGSMVALICTDRGFPEYRDIGETISLWLQFYTPADAFSTVEGETKGPIVKVTVEIIKGEENV